MYYTLAACVFCIGVGVLRSSVAPSNARVCKNCPWGSPNGNIGNGCYAAKVLNERLK